jgi:hypothetical protein
MSEKKLESLTPEELFKTGDPLDDLFASGTPVEDESIQSEISPLATAGIGELGAATGLYGVKKLGSMLGLTEEPKFEDQLKQLEAAKTAALQGATFNFADEIKSGAKALVTAPFSDKTLAEKYKEYQAIEQAKLKQIEEENPNTYLAGEIGGAILAPDLGVGKAIKGAKALQGLGKAGKVAATGLAAGGEFAAQGALQAAGQSEGELGSEELVSDVQEGATLGGALGGILGSAGKAIPMAAKGVAENLTESIAKSADEAKNPLFRQMSRAFTDAADTGKIVSEAERTAEAAKLTESTSEFTTRLTEGQRQIGEEMSKALKEASAKGIKINIDEPLQTVADQLQSFGKLRPDVESLPAYKKLLEKVFLLRNNKLSPEQAYKLSDEMYSFAGSLKSSPELMDVADSYAKGIRNLLKEQVPAFKYSSDQYKTFLSAGREALDSQGKPVQFREQWISDRGKNVERTYDQVRKMFVGMGQPGISTAGQAEMAQNIVKEMGRAEQKFPGTLKKLGYDSLDEMKIDMQRKGDRSAIAQSILGQTPKGEGIQSVADLVFRTISLGASPTARGVAMSYAQRAGQAMNSLYKASDDQLLNITKGLENSNNPQSKNIARTLSEAITNREPHRKNAALFLIQQNPQTRKEVLEAMGIKDEEGENEQQ